MTPVEIKNKIDDILDDYWHCDTYTKVTAVDAIYEIFSESLEELKAENERLKGLVKTQFFKYYDDAFQEHIWEEYAKENNL